MKCLYITIKDEIVIPRFSDSTPIIACGDTRGRVELSLIKVRSRDGKLKK